MCVRCVFSLDRKREKETHHTKNTHKNGRRHHHHQGRPVLDGRVVLFRRSLGQGAFFVSFFLLFRSFLLLLRYRSLSFSILTIDLQIQSGFGEKKASREETRAFLFSQIPTRRRSTRACFSSLFSILMMILMMRMRLPSNDDEYEY